MNVLALEIVGDGMEVVGVFFLSVEAIKLKNIYQLRDRFLLPMEHGLEPGIFHPEKTRWTPAELREDHLALRHFFLSHYGTGLAMIVGLLLVGCYFSSGLLSFILHAPTTARKAAAVFIVFLTVFPIVITLIATRRQSLSPPTIVMFLIAFTIIPVGIAPMLLGEAAHQGSRFLMRAILRMLEWIARNTPTGTIGILGFLAVCVGKLVQLIAGAVQP